MLEKANFIQQSIDNNQMLNDQSTQKYIQSQSKNKQTHHKQHLQPQKLNNSQQKINHIIQKNDKSYLTINKFQNEEFRKPYEQVTTRIQSILKKNQIPIIVKNTNVNTNKKQFYFNQKQNQFDDKNTKISDSFKKQSDEQKHAQQSINQIEEKLVRKIPSGLYESYEQLRLSMNIISQPMKIKNKANKNFKISKQNKNQLNHASQDFNQEIFAKLPIIQGHCIIKQKDESEQWFIILKNCLFYDNKKIYINNINKIKLLKDNQQLLIRFNYNNLEKDKQIVIIIKIIQKQQNQQKYKKTFEVFSQLILRRILLKNILINCSLNNNQNKQLQNIDYQAQLYKKNSIFGSWQKRKFKLTDKNLEIMKINGSIDEIKKISQIWTRFEMTYGYLVIKIWHKIQKIQIGIPLCEYTNKQQKNNWLYGLYKVLLYSKV